MTITTERLEEIAKLTIRLHQIRSYAAVTSSGETVMHHTHVGEILSALQDVTTALMVAREAVPDIKVQKALLWLDGFIKNHPGMKEPVTCRAAMLENGEGSGE